MIEVTLHILADAIEDASTAKRTRVLAMGLGGAVRQDAAYTLRGIRLLQSFSDAELGALEQRCRWRCAGRGQQILDRSSDDRDVFFVVSGSVRAVDFSPSGREVVYAVIAAGGHFGELSAIDGMERSACPAVQHIRAPRDLMAGRTRRRASTCSAAM